MKHVIVIETVDVEAGGKPIDPALREVLLRALEIGIEEFHGGVCFIQDRFNVQSAIAACHGMYELPPWNPEVDR